MPKFILVALLLIGSVANAADDQKFSSEFPTFEGASCSPGKSFGCLKEFLREKEITKVRIDGVSAKDAIAQFDANWKPHGFVKKDVDAIEDGEIVVLSGPKTGKRCPIASRSHGNIGLFAGDKVVVKDSHVAQMTLDEVKENCEVAGVISHPRIRQLED